MELVLARVADDAEMVFIDLSRTGPRAEEALHRVSERGVRMGVDGPKRLRAVTHLDIDAAQVDAAVTALQDILA